MGKVGKTLRFLISRTVRAPLYRDVATKKDALFVNTYASHDNRMDEDMLSGKYNSFNERGMIKGKCGNSTLVSKVFFIKI
jgi:hypothetical protein